MSIWVRSQNKETLANADKLYIGKNNNKYTINFDTYIDGWYILGTYKSKERAIEVLDEIDSKIMMNKAIEIYSNLGDLTFANRANYTYTPIYQMPKE